MKNEFLLRLNGNLNTLSKEELIVLFNNRIEKMDKDWLGKYLEAVDLIADFGNEMMYLWNNTGWDNKDDWSRKLDIIRKHSDLKKVLAVVNMTEEAFFEMRG